ncbi:MAG: hypothetical protein EB141_01595 [Verrucomicrobia bacterium]|nr:hypothetical protein [Verrucomicrobiota bacterium]NDB74337.1 hypothetical protein [Verrucomicrobiota bacterium]NDD36828.1 hypothetical protein [Verrucomicrobiota bacterium]
MRDRLVNLSRALTLRRVICLMAGAAVLLALREVGVLDWSLYRSSRDTECTIGAAMSAGGVELTPDDAAGSRGGWRIIELPGRSAMQLHYAEASSRPWTAWIPLIKFGTTTTETVFFVKCRGIRIIKGSASLRTSLNLHGLASARNYNESVAADSQNRIADWVQKSVADRPDLLTGIRR